MCVLVWVCHIRAPYKKHCCPHLVNMALQKTIQNAVLLGGLRTAAEAWPRSNRKQPGS